MPTGLWQRLSHISLSLMDGFWFGSSPLLDDHIHHRSTCQTIDFCFQASRTRIASQPYFLSDCLLTIAERRNIPTERPEFSNNYFSNPLHDNKIVRISNRQDSFPFFICSYLLRFGFICLA